MVRRRVLVLLAVAVLVRQFVLQGSASAGIISSPSVFTSSPTGAWRYSESPQFQAPGFSTTYFPTALSDYSSATFQGYVVPDAANSAITGGTTWFGNGSAVFEIFSTYVQSDFDQTIALNVAGDDGHSLFVDDAFVAGGAFSAPVQIDLVLHAGVKRKIEMAGYNGPANWVFVIGIPVSRPLPADNPEFSSPLDTIPGLKLSADGIFVPEPTTVCLFALGIIGLAAWPLSRGYL